MTKPEFRAAATELVCEVLGQSIVIPIRPRETARGFRWSGGQEAFVKVGKQWVMARVTITATVTGSGTWDDP